MTLPRAHTWPRRQFLLWPALAAAAEVQPAERTRYLDPGTEFEVFRVTDPKHASLLPPAINRIFPRRGGYLLYASDRGGTLQAYTIDHKKWESRPVTEAANLDPASLTLSPDDRSVIYADRADVRMVPTGGGSARTLYTFKTKPAEVRLSVTADGPSVLLADQNALMMVSTLARGGARRIAENGDGVDIPQARPARAAALYRSKDALWLAHFDGSRQTRLKTAPGGVGPATWSPDGRLVFYLHFQPGRAHALRQIDPDTGEDKQVAVTSQFAAFAANRDASVFVGASENKAGPYVLLLVRSVRRELVLCEHKASDAARVAPIFAPDSQKIFFQSDRHGKPAIYSMTVDRLVDKTEEEEAELERERSKPSR
jgi:oligogalacturonide lyase